jgi:hypothetical protein
MWEAILSAAVTTILMMFFFGSSSRRPSALLHENSLEAKVAESALYQQVSNMQLSTSDGMHNYAFTVSKDFKSISKDHLKSGKLPCEALTAKDWGFYAKDGDILLSKGIFDFEDVAVQPPCRLSQFLKELLKDKSCKAPHLCYVRRLHEDERSSGVYEIMLSGEMNLRIYAPSIDGFNLLKEFYPTRAHPIVSLKSVSFPPRFLIIISSHSIPEMFTKKIFFHLVERTRADPLLFSQTIDKLITERLFAEEYALAVIRSH